MSKVVSWLATHAPRWAGHRYPDLLWRLPTQQRIAYLTFDDGPTASMTSALLSVLAHHEAPATFFVLGRQVTREPALFREMLAAGHTVGNHSWAHPDAWRVGSRRVVAELERTTRLLEAETGRPVRWMRPPYGRFTPAMRAWAQTRRQRMVMWDLMPGDFLPTTSADHLRQRLANGLRPGSIVVLHDNPKAAITPAVLGEVLPRWLDDGWRFRALPP